MTEVPIYHRVLKGAGIDPLDASTEAAAVARAASVEIERLQERVNGLLEANNGLIDQRRAQDAKLAQAEGRAEALLKALAKENA